MHGLFAFAALWLLLRASVAQNIGTQQTEKHP
jgi:hypothetical protein